MIFITVGTQKYKFNRLIKYIKNVNLKDVVIQNGYTKCVSDENIRAVNFLKKEEMQKYINKAEFVISHGGITIVEILKMDKKLLVVPRKKKFKEHINDHQFELCEILEKQEYLLVARTEEEFKQKVQEIRNFKPKKYVSDSSSFFKNINKIIDDIV